MGTATLPLVDSEPTGAQSAETPVLSQGALVGLAGEVVAAISPFTEASEAALLADHMVTFGVQIQPGPYVGQGVTRQDTREQCLIVGASGAARKASSRIVMNMLYGKLPAPARVCEGVASGEALLEEFEDIVWSDENPPRVLFGNQDKRLLYYQSEFAQTLIISSRHGSPLSPLIRDMWDKRRIQYKKVGTRPRMASDFTVGVMGNITGEEFMSLLSARDISNGFANRMLYIWAERTKFLPFGPSEAELHAVLDPLAMKINRALERARTVGAVGWTDAAKEWWEVNYPLLSTITDGGYIGHMTGRRDMHVIRLALLYCLQASRSTLEVEDFQAAMALWQYSEDTVRYVVNKFHIPEEDRRGIASARSDLMRGKGAKLIEIIGESPGCTRTEIRRSFGNNLKAGELDRMVYMMCDLIEVTGKNPERFWQKGAKGT